MRAASLSFIAKRQKMVGADVRGQKNDGVGEIDPPALAVGKMPFIQQLQQHVEDVGMRLLDLVEQHDLIGGGGTASVRLPPSS